MEKRQKTADELIPNADVLTTNDRGTDLREEIILQCYTMLIARSLFGISRGTCFWCEASDFELLLRYSQSGGAYRELDLTWATCLQ